MAVIALCINGYGVFRYAGQPQTEPQDNGIQRFEPGHRARVEGLNPLIWRFETDQVDRSRIGVAYPVGPYTLSPAVEGTWTWDTARTLRFAPERPWPACSVFRIRADTNVVSVQSAPLTLLSARQVHVTADQQMVLALEFNDPPRLEQLTRHLKIRRAHGHGTVRYRVVGGAATRVVRIEVRPSQDSALRLTLTKGLRGTSGPLGLADTITREVRVRRTFALRAMQPRSHSFQSGDITVDLTHYVDAAAIEQHVVVDPPVPYAIKPYGRGFRIQGPFNAGDSYTVTLQPELANRNGVPLGTRVTRSVYFPDRPPGIAFVARGEHLSAAGNRLVGLQSVNAEDITISAERIYPNNFVQFAMRRARNYAHSRSWHRPEDGISRTTGTLTLALAGSPANQMVTNRIDLTELMGDHECGAYQLTARTKSGQRVRRLVVVSDIGIAAKRSNRDLLVWANSLRTMRPHTNATVQVFSRANQELAHGRTDTNGLFHVQTPDESPFLITVQTDDDMAYLSLDESGVRLPGDTGGRPHLHDGYEACIFTDRGIYRPGETSHVHAIVRNARMDVAEPFPVVLEVMQPDGRLFRTEQGMLSDLGTAGFSVAWPDYAPTGRYALRLKLPGAERVIGSTAVAVEAFVPPGIAVDLETPANPTGTELAFTVAARHLFGPPAARLKATGKVVYRPVSFAPDKWTDYHFGDAEKEFTQKVDTIGDSPLDGEGRATFATTVPADWDPPAAIHALLVGTVQESGGRTVSAFASRTIDPYPHYIGLKLDAGTRIPAGEMQQLELAVVRPDQDLAPMSGPLHMAVHRVDWITAVRERNGRHAYQSERRLSLAYESHVVLNNGKGRVSFSVDHAGAYLLQVTDPSTGASSSRHLYASTPHGTYQPWSMHQPDRIDLELDRATYQPGDIARLLIKAPFAGKALLTLESDRLLETRVIDLHENTREIEIPVKQQYLPNVYCTLTVLRPVVARELWVPHRAIGVVPLRVTEPMERLVVAIDAPETIRPLEPLSVHVQVTNASRQPVTGEVVLAAVDEGICRLTRFPTPDPLEFFRAKRRLGVHHYDLYDNLLPELDDVLDGTASTTGGDMMGAVRGRLNPIRARRFKPTALWSGPVQTDAQGRASVTFDIPEFTGQLRVMAVAIAPQQFGSAAKPVTVKRSLVVRSSLPRFLAPGDHSTLFLQVFNQTGGPREVSVRVRCDGPLAATATNRMLNLATGEDHAFTVPLAAGGQPGLGRVHLEVLGETETYRETIELAVRPLSPRVYQSGFGVVEPNQQVEVSARGDWLDGTARTDLWCAGLPLLKLAGGLNYLLRYPYGCVEQTTSSSFPLLYLADLAELLYPGSMGREEIDAYVEAGIHRLLSMQKQDGSFGYWSHASTPYHWGSIYATHFLVEANRAGHPVPPGCLSAALGFMQSTLDRHEVHAEAWQVDRRHRAYAAYVLALAERPPSGWISRLLEESTELHPSAQLHAIAALALAGQRPEAGRTLESFTPTLTRPASSNTCIDSPTRDVALLLSTWLHIDPHHPNVASLARQLEAASHHGRWRTTQENAMCLLALGKYGRHLRGQQRSFTARAGTRSFTHEEVLHLQPTNAAPITIANDGPGRLFYYWQSSGVLTARDIEEVDRRLSVRRSLLDQDGNPLDDNRVLQGELVVVRLDVETLGPTVDQLVITDLLPAGLEIEHSKLSTSRQFPWLSKQGVLHVRHHDVRDDRILLFTGNVSGKQHFHYAARAVTPGTYGYAPVAAEGMYDPEARSVHGATRFTVVGIGSAE